MMIAQLALSLAAPLAVRPAPAPQEPSLLPAAPEGWRGERIEFPLPFAPDIELEGYEQLAFAPGMFEPDSPTYFSYAFAIHIEGDRLVDQVFLESFLDRYYRGLCAAVASDRELQLAPGTLDAIRSRVAPGGHGFVGAIDLFDPFTTGEALQLALEIQVHSGEAATEVLALASPLPASAAVWSELEDIGRRWRAARPVRSYLNHIFIVPDEVTYRVLAGSDFLRSFGTLEERTTVRKDISYTGLYLYGRHTYFEFLKPDDSIGFSESATGLAFGFEGEGDTARMAERLAARGVQTFPGPRTRELDGKAVPWFTILGVQQASAESSLNLFSLEYDPGFLAGWHGDLAPRVEGRALTERAPVLTRYVASLDALAGREAAALGDVIEVHLALDSAELGRVLETCRAFDYRIESSGGRTVVHAPGFVLRIRASEEPGGVTGFVTSLRRPVDARTISLGRLTITLEGHTATFRYASE